MYAIKRGPPKRFSKSRVCKKRGCKQRLNIYNAQVYCYLHTESKYDQQ